MKQGNSAAGKRVDDVTNTKGSYFDEYSKKAGSKVDFFDANKFNIWEYLKVEMLGIGEPGTLEPPSESHIRNFFLVPLYLEALICLGFFICLDAFLYVITYLPIRVVFSLYLLVAHLLGAALPNLYPSKAKPELQFHRTHTYDLMRGAMFFLGCMALRQINMSHIYHYIRGQSMIKLYVLTSMLEIIDKLLCSFGQDAFDSLHWQTRHHPRSLTLFMTFVMVTGYVIVHSSVYFFHVATLTVVVNSVDKELITVLILNNFSELKTFVLKKFDCNNLFQLACSDITERFQSFLFLSLIFIVALAQAGPAWRETVYMFVRLTLMVFVGECFADWMKHAFINKFNMINATVYEDFAYVLRNDILSNQKDEVILDHTYSVTRRLGLSQIPLGCVCIRYIMLACNTPLVQLYFEGHSAFSLLLQSCLLFLALVLLKVVIGVGLVFYSAGAHQRDANVFLRSPAGILPSHSSNVGSAAASGVTMISAKGPMVMEASCKKGPSADTHSSVGIPEIAPVMETRRRGNSISNPFTELNVDEMVSAVGQEMGIPLSSLPLPLYIPPGIASVAPTQSSVSPTNDGRPPKGPSPRDPRDPQQGTFFEHEVSGLPPLTPPMSPSNRANIGIGIGGGVGMGGVGIGVGVAGGMGGISGGDLVFPSIPIPIPSSNTPTHHSTPTVQLSNLITPAPIPMASLDSCDAVGTGMGMSIGIGMGMGMGVGMEEEEDKPSDRALFEASRMKERLEFMEELSSIERYTVYKGRIL
ncbi:eukaryotic membrane protein family-domain-containing protein [Ochromonadaceae sp. CCMP2298]|nr:eukaryotic membrane protein family-domain-containing protein [Ochromonadaceae sp. CCMP2298]